MEEKKQEQQNKEQFKEKEAIDLSSISNPAELLQESTDKLEKFGGFDLVENTIDGVQKLNPKKKATKQIFLSEKQFKAQRDKLKESLKIWADLLSQEAGIPALVEQCETKSQEAEKTLKENLKKAIDATKDLERSYRSVALFYKNTENDQVKYISLMNASQDQLRDLDNPRFIDACAAELNKHFDRLSLKNNYSIMCVPGYLGSKAVLDKWGKFAHISCIT